MHPQLKQTLSAIVMMALMLLVSYLSGAPQWVVCPAGLLVWSVWVNGTFWH